MLGNQTGASLCCVSAGVVIKKNCLYSCILIFYFFSSSPVVSAVSDTITMIQTGNGTAGPYQLGTPYIDSSSLSVSFLDSRCGHVPEYTYISPINSLIFSEIINPNCTLVVRFTLSYWAIPKITYLYKRKFYSPSDSDTAHVLFNQTNGFAEQPDNLNISGFKSIGVSIGNQGQLNVQQALEVKVYGNIKDHTQLSAHISDQATSLEGDTKEISELDRIYVSLVNHRYAIVAGDQYVSMLKTGIISSQKKVKGISTSVTFPNLNASVFGALSGGNLANQTITTRLGFQGPYYLTGNNEAVSITPIQGTVTVSVNGEFLEEGETNDYCIDYTAGSIRFNPRFALGDNQIVHVSYEYKIYNYLRTFSGVSTEGTTQDSSFSYAGVLWYEADNKNQPLDVFIDENAKSILSQTGDNAPFIPNGKKIQPVTVAAQNAVNRLYKIKYVSTANDFFYQFTPFDNETPLENKDFYLVWFNRVSEQSGDYVQFSRTLLADTALINSLPPLSQKTLRDPFMEADPRGPVYLYVGPGKGNYSALSPIPTPQAHTTGEVQLAYNPHQYLQFKTDVVGQTIDKNLFSPKDDYNNNAAMIQTECTVGKNSSLDRSAFITLLHHGKSTFFTLPLFTAYEQLYQWDLADFPITQKEEHLYGALFGITPFSHVSSNFSYQQYQVDQRRITDKYQYGILYNRLSNIEILYRGATISPVYAHRTTVTDSLTYTIRTPKTTYSVRIDDLWKQTIEGPSAGSIGSLVMIRLIPQFLQQSFYFNQHRKGGSSIFLPLHPQSHDTGYNIIWTQNAEISYKNYYNATATSSYQYIEKRKTNQTAPSNQSSLLITTTNSLSYPKSGISSQVTYTLNSEKASNFIQIPIFVGKGQGTHIYDSITASYKPDLFGDFIIEEREYFDQTNTDNIRKSLLSGSVQFKPMTTSSNGILSDLAWNGYFHLEEHFKKDTSMSLNAFFPFKSLFPGLSTLQSSHQKLISYAYLFYLQEIVWTPSFTQGLLGKLSGKPSFKNTRTLRENSMEYSSIFTKQWDSWELSIEFKQFSLIRRLLYQAYPISITDRYATTKERYFIFQGFSLFCNQTIGKTQKESYSGLYFQLVPGITYQVYEKGWAELSYTWSKVNCGGLLEYPMAKGSSQGIQHSISAIATINIKTNLIIDCAYRSEYAESFSDRWLHVLSMELKALL